MPSYLKRPDSKSAPDLKAIRQLIASKGKGWAKLRGIMPFLQQSFELYPSQLSSNYRFTRLRPANTAAKTLHNLYDSRRKAFRYISELRERGRNKLGCCPYCGLPGNITLDHYLPRDLTGFPHYSALETNLVPACFDCQLLKRNYIPVPSVGARRNKVRQRIRRKREPLWSKKRVIAYPVRRLRKRMGALKASQASSTTELPFHGDRRFVHPYYDSFLGRPVLTLRASENLKRNLYIEVRNCNVREQAILRFHLRKLKVEQRLTASFERFQSIAEKSFRERNIRTISAAEQQLDYLVSEAIKRGKAINNLEAVTMRHLRADEFAIRELLRRAKEPIPHLVQQTAARKTGASAGSSIKPIAF